MCIVIPDWVNSLDLTEEFGEDEILLQRGLTFNVVKSHDTWYDYIATILPDVEPLHVYGTKSKSRQSKRRKIRQSKRRKIRQSKTRKIRKSRKSRKNC